MNKEFKPSNKTPEGFYNYQKFIEKFADIKTTDDCITPPEVYRVVRDFVIDKYKLSDKEIIRPFVHGGDYQSINYKDNQVVIDNPPFSIITQIVRWYLERDIKFYLFVPHLTLFSINSKNVAYIIINSQIKYDNGAKVNTDFITNLEIAKIKTEPQLRLKIKGTQKSKKQKAKYNYPKNLITSACLGKYADDCISISLNDAHFVLALDSQKEKGKRIFGAGYLIGNKDAEQLYKYKCNPDAIDWQLSNREKELIK